MSPFVEHFNGFLCSTMNSQAIVYVVSQYSSGRQLINDFDPYSSSRIGNSKNTVTFTVTDVVDTQLDYNSSLNGDSDGDSNGTSISVNKP